MVEDRDASHNSTSSVTIADQRDVSTDNIPIVTTGQRDISLRTKRNQFWFGYIDLLSQRDLDPPKWEKFYTHGKTRLDLKKTKKSMQDDFRLAHLDYYKLWSLGAEYMLPPFPHTLSNRDNAVELRETYSKKWLIELLYASDVGFGTDPELLEQTIMNVKAPVLDRALFPTLDFDDNLHRPFQKAHVLLQDRTVSKNNKINFGLGVHFEGISVGFKIAHDSSKISQESNLLGVADEGYRWAKTRSHLKHEKLYRYLHRDCVRALFNMKQEMEDFKKARKQGQGIKGKEAHQNLSYLLTDFIEKYGTHVVLECSHGYRKLQVEKKTMEEVTSIQEFRSQIGVKCMDILKILSFESDHKKAEENLKAEKSDEKYYVGSPISLSRALCENFGIKTWHRLVSAGGDAKVICHDKTMMIADVVQYCSRLSDVSQLLKFWTFTRVRDLQQGMNVRNKIILYKFFLTQKPNNIGWDKSLFACSYKLTFKKKDSEGVYVDVYGKRHMNSYVFQEPVDEKTSVSYITPVRSTHVVEVKVSTADDKQKLSDKLIKMEIFLRKFPDELISSSSEGVKPMGEVLAYTINVDSIRVPSFKICFDCCGFVSAKRITTSRILSQ